MRATVFLTCFALLALAGCGSEGPGRYDLSGVVTYNGQPVPGGEVIFTPDAAQGNTGPGSFATIKHGRYETYRGKGTIGGPHVVTVIGYKDVPGEVPDDQLEQLFEQRQFKLDLPRESGTHDIEVPVK